MDCADGNWRSFAAGGDLPERGWLQARLIHLKALENDAAVYKEFSATDDQYEVLEAVSVGRTEGIIVKQIIQKTKLPKRQVSACLKAMVDDTQPSLIEWPKIDGKRTRKGMVLSERGWQTLEQERARRKPRTNGHATTLVDK